MLHQFSCDIFGQIAQNFGRLVLLQSPNQILTASVACSGRLSICLFDEQHAVGAYRVAAQIFLLANNPRTDADADTDAPEPTRHSLQGVEYAFPSGLSVFKIFLRLI